MACGHDVRVNLALVAQFRGYQTGTEIIFANPALTGMDVHGSIKTIIEELEQED
jgi:hypothetical protein